MTNEEILKFTDEIFDEACALRRKIHQNPELGNKEFETTALIEDYLKGCKIKTERPLETGAVGFLDAGKSETVALRADIDALPVTEQTGLDFSSKKEGLMHACGHDIHTSALLAAAKIISKNKDSLSKNVLFVFQPDEEGSGGAQRLLQKGIFEKYNVQSVFGLHVRPEIASGKVAVKFGKSYAASDIFKITVSGKSSHGAEPQNGISALTAASHIVCALEGAVSRLVSPTDSAVLSVCTFESGTAVNIIPETAVLSGIIRTLGPQTRKMMKEKLLEISSLTAKAFSCTSKLEIRESYPGVVNDNEKTAFVQKNAGELFGLQNVDVLDEPTMTTEDFGYYLQEVPGCFFHVGVGCDYPLHSGKMTPSEEGLKTAIAMHVKNVFEA